ncbi:hypothetical protein RchiOBHm_Chr6g0274451 [Rosa chinensis]|uniref:Uncharacterized protein n=1 Tax=Rosa chinensis TaxID=74649 RepID=A0A2P6PRQ7_ROSCH|nr:hypothetical protein RchiOBHm_Chr6g0274451 [Rosa chinensis]
MVEAWWLLQLGSLARVGAVGLGPVYFVLEDITMCPWISTDVHHKGLRRMY